MNVAVTSMLTPTAQPMSGGFGLSIQDVSKAYQHPALAQVSLEVAPGELLAVTGPSGAGKTTLCRIIAGLERPNTGALSLAGKDLMPVPAGRRRVAFMFESYALYPHMTVRDNVRSPLLAANRRAAANSPVARQRVEEVLELLEIAHLHDRLPGAMSGGQKQRVALARALVQQPRCICSTSRSRISTPSSGTSCAVKSAAVCQPKRRRPSGRRRTAWKPCRSATASR